VYLTASPLRLTSPLPLLPASSLRARPFAPFARSILRNPTAYCLLFVITNEIKYNPRAFIQHSGLR